MAEKILVLKDELITGIKDRAISLLQDDLERNINLRNVYFYNSDLLDSCDRTNITCIFVNSEGNLCVDMYRSGYDVSMNYICGILIDSLDEKILKRIVRAFDEGKCSAEDFSTGFYERNKRSNLLSVFKSAFFQKSA
jgi:hypothetical protein